MSASLRPVGIKLGDGLGDFMKFTSDAYADGPPASDSGSADDTGRRAEESRSRPIKLSGARSTGRH